MRAVFAIALQTARSAFRSKVFFVILILTFVATALLPSSVVGDATLAGEFRIKINYSIGIITFLTGLAALWVGTINMSREIEAYQIHMVLTKPVSGLRLWLGKFLGVAVLCGGVLFISSSYIYYIITSEIEDIRAELVDKSGRIMIEARDTLTKDQKMELAGSFFVLDRLVKNYSTPEEVEVFKTLTGVESPDKISIKSRLKPLVKRFEEFDQLNNEILTGRTFYRWTKPDYQKLAIEEIRASKRIKPNMPEDFQQQILAEETRSQESKYGSLPVMKNGQPVPKVFKFENLPPIKADQPLFIRFRVFAGDSLDQKPRNTAIAISIVTEGEDGKKVMTQPAEFFIRSTRFYTERLNPAVLQGKTKFELLVFNLDHLGRRSGKPSVKELVIQAQDGPSILIGQTQFASNYWRCIALIALFIAFLVIVGTTSGVCFTTPVAVMISASYIIVGVGVSSVLSTDSQYQVVKYEGQLEDEAIGSETIKSFHKVLRFCMVSVDTFSRMEFLSSGKAITWGLVLKVLMYDFILKGLPLLLIGLYALQRREFGLVVRK